MAKREDHPLWGAFSKHMEACKPEQAPGYWHYHWQDFLAGGEAMAEYLPKKVAAAHVTPRCKVLADCFTDAVTRLEILGKQPTPMELSHVANRFNLSVNRLDGAADRLTTLNNFCEGMAALVVQLEALCKKQESFGNRQGEVTCQMNEHTTSLYNLVRRQEHAIKRLEELGKKMQGMDLRIAFAETAGDGT